MKNFKKIALLLVAAFSLSVGAAEINAQQQKAAPKTHKTQGTRPAVPAGAIATFTADKNAIYLMPDGVIKSNNSNIVGNWKENRSFDVYIVTVGDKRYDGATMYMIDKAEAYPFFNGSSDCTFLGYSRTHFFINVESEAGEDSIDLSDVEPLPVKWLK